MKKTFIIRIIRLLSNLAIAGFAVAVIAILLLLPDLPDIDSVQELELKVPLRVYSNDGLLMGEYGSERRIPVTIDDAPTELIAAILAAEDDRYYEHVGIDYQGLLRALYVNIQSGAKAQGASTITMQVARNYFLTKERTYIRKAKEILLALRLEQLLTKDEILELYLNKIFLGHRTYGFGAAAMAYYGQPLSELNVAQYAMLAALPKAPSRVNPITNPDNARIRRDYILKRMSDLDYISSDEYQAALAQPLTAKLHLAEVQLKAPYVAEAVRQSVYEVFGESAYEAGYSAYATISSRDQNAAVVALRNGLISYDMRHGFRGALRNWDIDRLDTDQKKIDALKRIEPSQDIIPVLVIEVMDDRVQAFTRSAQIITIPWEQMKWARRYETARKLGPEPKQPSDVVQPGDIVFARPVNDGEWMLSQIPAVEGALIAISPVDGAIKAMVGGFDYYLGKFNRATQAERQMGSNIKPFVYSAALESGFTAASFVSGAPVVVENKSTQIVWRPENYSGKFFGQVRLRKALGLSLNLVSVRLIRGMGPEFAIDHISRFGFDRETLPEGLSLALGSAQATPLDVVTGYAVFANGGYEVDPYLIDVVKDKEGKVIMHGKISEVCHTCLGDESAADEQEYSGLFQPVRPAERVISSSNAYILNDMLREVVRSGTARRAKALNRTDLGGKTGTTNDFEDAWFSGFNSQIAATVWVGFDQPADLGRHEAGSKAALPVWIDFMREALDGLPEKEVPMPDNVVAVRIDGETGKAIDQESENGLREVFVIGSEPQIPSIAVTGSSGSGAATVGQSSIDDLF